MPTVNDDFNRSNENPLSGGGNWATCTGFDNLRLDSNHVGGTVNSADCFMYWDADEFDPDHSLEINIYGSGFHQPIIRVNSSATNDFYTVYIAGLTSCFFYYVSGGSFHQVGSEFNPNASSGDLLRFEASGNNLTADFQGVEEGAESDSTFPNNTKLGLGMYSNGYTTEYLDNFEGSDGLGGTTTSTSTSTSTSTTTTSSSTSTSTTTTLDPNSGGLAFGEESPTEGEIPISWQTWSDGAAGLPVISGDPDWGKVELGVGTEGRSYVYDFGNSSTRQITITRHRYGSGSGDPTIEIRGHDSTPFSQDDGSPSWEEYTGPTSKTWRYIQVRMIES